MTKGKDNISLAGIFGVFAKIGTFTIGGGYAMVPLIRDELISRGWISEEEFPDILALSQMAPGLLAVNFSIFAGYRMRGMRGALVATLGSCLTPFLLILAIAMFFSGFKDNPVVIRIFQGMRPAVVALIAVPMIQMARSACKNWWSWALTIAAMLLVALLKVSPIYILLVTLIVALAICVAADRRRRRNG